MNRRLPLTSILLLLVLGSVAAWSLLTPTVGSADTAGAIALKLSPADSAEALDRLADDLARLVTLEPEIRTGQVGIEVFSLRQNRPIFQLNAERPLTPASTTKLVTAFTALSELGADHMVRTVVGLTNRPTREGVLVGDVYVRGHGDPFLTASDVDALVDQFMLTGIKRIEGNIIGDGSYFDDKTRRTEYSGDADPVMTLPPITALTIDNSVFTVLVSAPSAPGLPLNVQTVPRSSALRIVNQAVSAGAAKRAPSRAVRKKSRRRSSLESIAPPAVRGVPETPRYGDEEATATAAAPVRGLRVQVETTPEGEQTITVTGSLGINKRASYRYPMSKPSVVVAGMIHERLASRGVRITGRAVPGEAPGRIKVMAQVQRPLTEIMNLVMKNSNNFLAEMVFKMIGADAGARRETAAASVQRITRRMGAAGVDFERCVINDGSGLSRANALTASSLTEMLVAAHRSPAVFPALYESMSIAGVDGTLRKRLKGTLAEGNLHGKTGTLRNVSALVGYVTSRDGEVFAFACLMNGTNHATYRAVQDRIAKRLAEFTYRPDEPASAAAKPSAAAPRPKR